MSQYWREWSRRYQPRRRTWRVGDRFQMNRIPEPLVFEITSTNKRFITFYAPGYDDNTAARRCTREWLYRQGYARKIVRVQTPEGDRS